MCHVIASLFRSGCLSGRPFRYLFLGQGASILGDAMNTIAIAFAVIELTGSKTDLGKVLMARALPLVVFLLIGGVWADRLPRRLVMLTSDVIRGACQTVLAVALLTDSATIPLMMGVMVVYGSAEAFFRPALSGLVPQTVSAEHLQQAQALLGMTPALGLALGSIAGGAIVTLVGPAGAIAADAGTFVLSAASLAAIRLSGAALAAPRARGFVADLAEGWNEFRSRSWLVTVVAGETLYSLLVMPAIFVLGPFVADRSLGGANGWAVVISSFGVGLLAGGAVSMRLRPRRPLVAAYLVTIPFTGWLIVLASVDSLPSAVRLPLLSATCIVSGATIAIAQTLLETTITQNVPAVARSRISSWRLLGSVSCQPIGFALIGPVAGAIGTSTAIWLGAAAVAVNIVVVVGMPSVRAITASGMAPVTADAGW